MNAWKRGLLVGGTLIALVRGWRLCRSGRDGRGPPQLDDDTIPLLLNSYQSDREGDAR